MISIIIPAVSALPLHLFEQDFPRWQVLMVGPEAPASPDGSPFRAIAASGSPAALLNRGLDASDSEYVLFLRPSDRLLPGALASLVRAASRPGVAGAVGGFRFTSPIGVLPAPGMEGPGVSLDTLDQRHLLRLRPTAALISRRVLGEIRLRTDLNTGWELDLLLRLAAQGQRFAFDPAPVVLHAMEPVADHAATLADLATHIRILADLVSPAELPVAAADLVDAIIVLRAHQRSIGTANLARANLATATRFPSLFGQWWHRCGVRGPAPRHVLDANGGVAEAVTSDPVLIARRILSMCPRGRAPILLGLGRNARVLARELHSAGAPVIGRDESGTPAWAAEDGISVTRVPSDAPFDHAATYIMTVLHDDGFLAKLPAGLRIIRWRTTPELILAEWRSAALDWALRTAVREPKPALAGVSA